MKISKIKGTYNEFKIEKLTLGKIECIKEAVRVYNELTEEQHGHSNLLAQEIRQSIIYQLENDKSLIMG